MLPLVALGCGGTDPTPPSADGGAAADMVTAPSGSGDGGLLALFAPCTTPPQCQSGVCTQTSYDRSPTPICTYKCDASNMNPMCPMGCNPKGYCKKPM